MTLMRNTGEPDASYDLRRCAHAGRLLARGLPAAAARALLPDEPDPPPREFIGACRVVRFVDTT
jgi:hypothetical protein